MAKLKISKNQGWKGGGAVKKKRTTKKKHEARETDSFTTNFLDIYAAPIRKLIAVPFNEVMGERQTVEKTTQQAEFSEERRLKTIGAFTQIQQLAEEGKKFLENKK